MNRRGFLRMMGLAPVGIAAGAALPMASAVAGAEPAVLSITDGKIATAKLTLDTTEFRRLLEQHARTVEEIIREAQSRRKLP